MVEIMSVAWGADLHFDQEFLKAFGDRKHVQTHFVPNTRLDVYKQLLSARSAEPDLLEMDIVWPSILAEDLVDLRPYLGENAAAFPPQILANYTVHDRLVALPLYLDVGVLYYRPELLTRYGFRQPPDTWEQLEMMASRIQAGERAAGNKNFWGYTWQGSATEGGTCNALEWQSSAGAGNFVEAPGSINVRRAVFAKALLRATSWIGTISPPAEYAYHEDDSVNLWNAGKTAFMRNWASGANQLATKPGKDQRLFGVAPLPAGPGGHKGTLGGAGIAVSKYSANRDLAIQALLELTSEQNDLARMNQTGGIPTHIAVLAQPGIKARSPLLSVAQELVKDVVSRPSLVTGETYEIVSHEYAVAANSVLRRKATPEAALSDLEKKLQKLTGFPAQRPN